MASRFWVGGTGTWDASDTTHWAASSNGAGGQSVPGSADNATFDGFSGGGTATLGAGYTPSIVSLVLSAYTGTLDLSANNNNMTLSGNWTDAASGAHTVTLGSGTITLNGAAATADFTGANLTISANTATISFTSTTPTSLRTLSIGGKTQIYGVNVAGCTGSNLFQFCLNTTGGATIDHLTLAGPLMVTTVANTTLTISSASVWTGTGLTGLINLGWSTRVGATKSTISAAGAITGTYVSLEGVTGAGAGTLTFTNSLNLGGNSGSNLTIGAVSAGSGGGIIG